jgi:hypothetical protein
VLVVKLYLGLSERIKTSGVIGAIVGIILCIGGAAIGGYYIGIAVSDYLHLYNVIGRMALTLVITVLIGRIAYPLGLYAGSLTGRAIGLAVFGSLRALSLLSERLSRPKRIPYPVRKKRYF